MSKDQFLTRRWNNILLLALGIPTLAFAALALWGPGMSDLAFFVGMAVLGAAY